MFYQIYKVLGIILFSKVVTVAIREGSKIMLSPSSMLTQVL